jgi:hypothetical protein
MCAAVDSLKALDPEWPIREADIRSECDHVNRGAISVRFIGNKRQPA